MDNRQSDSGAHNVKITAIMPVYNSAAFLSHAVQSLLDQTEAFDEIIIVDDGSTDHSVELIEAFRKNNPHIHLIKHAKNQGVNPAVNTGLKQASGDYVLMCATDDWFSPNLVTLVKRVACQYPHVGVICGDAIVRRFDLKQPFYRMLPYPSNQILTSAEFKRVTQKSYAGFNGGGMVMNRQAIMDAGMLHPATRWHGDWLLYFVLALRQGVYYCNTVFIHINMRKLSYSEGKKSRKKQSQVMLDTIVMIEKYYPEHWHDFKKAAIVPHHALRYIILFLLHPVGRRFVTKRFIWKMLINNPLVTRIGRLFPYRVILKARKLLRA